MGDRLPQATSCDTMDFPPSSQCPLPKAGSPVMGSGALAPQRHCHRLNSKFCLHHQPRASRPVSLRLTSLLCEMGLAVALWLQGWRSNEMTEKHLAVC